jgi:hypothetical protein
MRIVNVPNHVSREELLEEVQRELDALDSCGKAIVLVNDKKIRYHKDVDMGMHHIRYMPLKRTLDISLRGQTADIVAIERIDDITIAAIETILLVLNYRANANAILICPERLGVLLQ